MATLSFSQYVKNSVSFMKGGKPITRSMSKEEVNQELDRQCKLVAESDRKDLSLQEFMDEDFEDVDGWIA